MLVFFFSITQIHGNFFQYTTLLRAYKALLNYVHWRQNNEMSQEELTSVYEDLEAAVNVGCSLKY